MREEMCGANLGDSDALHKFERRLHMIRTRLHLLTAALALGTIAVAGPVVPKTLVIRADHAELRDGIFNALRPYFLQHHIIDYEKLDGILKLDSIVVGCRVSDASIAYDSLIFYADHSWKTQRLVFDKRTGEELLTTVIQRTVACRGREAEEASAEMMQTASGGPQSIGTAIGALAREAR
jgi:hypothetical protein